MQKAGFQLFECTYYTVNLSLLHPLSPILLLCPSSFFFLFLPLLLYRSPRPIHLTPGPSAPLLFDVSLISPRLSTLVISSIFQRYRRSPVSSLSLPVPSFLSILLFCHYATSTSTSFSLLLLLFSEYVIFQTWWCHPSLTGPGPTPFSYLSSVTDTDTS